MITVDNTSLYNLLRTGLVCAGTDMTLPMLAAVRLETDGSGTLYAVSTDRFRLGLTRVPCSGTDTLEWLAPVDEVKRLVQMLKPARGRNAPQLSVQLSEVGTPPLSERRLQWTRSDGLSGTIGCVDAQFPKWRKLYADALDREPGSTIVSVTPEYLADMAKAKWQAGDALILEAPQRSSQPIVIRVGEHFLGLLMPVRRPAAEDDVLRKDWQGVVGS